MKKTDNNDFYILIQFNSYKGEAGAKQNANVLTRESTPT